MFYSSGNITNFKVWVGSSESTSFSSDYTLCTQYTDLVELERLTLSCDQPIVGQYLAIERQDTEQLNLCEVQVYTVDGEWKGSFICIISLIQLI